MLIRIEKNLDVLTLRATLRYVHASYRRLAAMQARPELHPHPCLVKTFHRTQKHSAVTSCSVTLLACSRVFLVWLYMNKVSGDARKSGLPD